MNTDYDDKMLRAGHVRWLDYLNTRWQYSERTYTRRSTVGIAGSFEEALTDNISGLVVSNVQTFESWIKKIEGDN